MDYSNWYDPQKVLVKSALKIVNKNFYPEDNTGLSVYSNGLLENVSFFINSFGHINGTIYSGGTCKKLYINSFCDIHVDSRSVMLKI